jgi:hypothetical protein
LDSQIGQQIADFPAKANPNWPQATMRDVMKTHLVTTTDEVTARLKKDWDAEVKAYDAVPGQVRVVRARHVHEAGPLNPEGTRPCDL